MSSLLRVLLWSTQYVLKKGGRLSLVLESLVLSAKAKQGRTPGALNIVERGVSFAKKGKKKSTF